MSGINKPQSQNNNKFGRVYLPDNSQVDFEYDIVDVGDLETSHDDDMRKNAKFPQELQPRDRGDRIGYLAQVEDISNKLNPELLASSPTAADGAPIIGRTDNFVESGNGRTIAIRKALMRNTPKGKAYREWVKGNLDTYGLSDKDISEMKNPVLVRRRTSKIEDKQKFTKEANRQNVATFSPSEQAKIDSDSLTVSDIAMFRPTDEGEVTGRSNQGFVNAFLDKMSPSERVGYLTEDGTANTKLADRIKSAIFQKAYGSKKLSIMVSEETSVDIKNILNGLIKAAPNFVKARALSENFDGNPIVDDIVGAIEYLRRAKREYEKTKSGNGKTAIQNQLENLLSQSVMFEDKPPNKIVVIAKVLADNNNSGKRLGEFFDHIGSGLRGFLGEKNQGELFGEKNILTTQELTDKAKKFLGDKYDERQQDLFSGHPNTQLDTGTERKDSTNTGVSGDRKDKENSGNQESKEKPDVNQGSQYGSKNKVFTKDDAEKARETLKRKLSGNQLNTGVDPEILMAGIQLAGYHIEAGARSFADYSKAMVSDMGDVIKPYLQSFYDAIKTYPGFDNTGMDGISTTKESESLDPEDTSPKLIDDRIDKKYAEIDKLAENETAEDNADPDIYEKIQEGSMSAEALKNFIEGSEDKDSAIQGVKYAISHRLGDLKETYKYEGFKDGKRLEDYIDELLSTLPQSDLQDNGLPDNNPENETTPEKTGDLSNNTGIEKKGNENVNKHDTSEYLKQDSGNAKTGDPMGEGNVRNVGRAETQENGTGVQAATEKNNTASGEGVLRREAPPLGKQGDQSPYNADEPDPTKGGDAGDIDNSGSGDGSIDGQQPNRIPTKRIVKTAAKRDDLESKLKAQADATANKQGLKNISGDLENIKETLPMLFHDQAKDVQFAELRFEKPDGHGVMFTNGTGTGKTFSGLGIANRFFRKGKKNILVIAPDNPIIDAWTGAAKMFDMPIHKLLDKNDVGKDLTITTYSNFRDNPNLIKRAWDLIIADEAHDLSQNKSGSSTGSLENLRAITRHPRGVETRTRMMHQDVFDEISDASEEHKKNKTLETSRRLKKAYDNLEKIKEGVRKDVAEGEKTKVVFLSATPFAYEKSIDYAEGFLFHYGENQGHDGYNQPDAYQQFMIDHFGYRMRYNKLTEPESDVDRGLMQRQFNSWLKTEGSLSSRMLEVGHDYDRKFVLTESAVGTKIDEGFDFLHKNYERFNFLSNAIVNNFNYLKRRYLLEAIKAKEVIPIIKQHMALGRKVIVFHDYIKGGSENPFDTDAAIDDYKNRGQEVPEELYMQGERFKEERPDLANLPLGNLKSPIETLRSAFPDLLEVNGQTVKGAQVQKNINTFNLDSSGPQVMIVQSDKDRGWSGHDTTGKHNRVLINLGLPTRPTRAIQQEGRIFRIGQASDAMFRYLNTGTNWERWAFAETIAQRASAAENLAMGEEARALQDSFIAAFEDSDSYPPGFDGEGTGGKDIDAANNAAISAWDRAKTFYFSQQKKTSRTKAQEGNDYFATPEPLGLKMVEWADLKPNEKALEPSAGHGAIARWFPENISGTSIEPSDLLSSKLKMVTPGHKVIQGRFEDLNIQNKFDAIVMNPPFGSSGKTAMDHIEKAFVHLREGGRIVAIVPNGPAMQKRMDTFLYGFDEKGKSINPSAVLVADMVLPGVTFKRAGTAVNCKVLIIDKLSNMDDFTDLPHQTSKTFSDTKDIKDFFDQIEHVSVPARMNAATNRRESIPTQQKTVGEKSQNKPQNLVVERSGHSVFKYKVTGDTFKHRNVISGLVNKDDRMWDSTLHGWLFKENPTAKLRDALGDNIVTGESSIAENRAKYSTKSPAFKKWFGDSKVIGEDGEPLVVYKGMLKNDWETGNEINIIKSPNGPWAGFFSSQKNVAQKFQKAFATMGEARTVEAYLKIEKPYIVDAKGGYAKDFSFDDKVFGKDPKNPGALAAFNNGYDGVIIKNTADEGDVYIPKEPSQVKSTQNTGTWDGSNPDIRFQTDQKPGQGMSFRDIQNGFNGQRVLVATDGSINVHFKNGLGVKVKSVEHIGGNDFKFAFESGQVGKDGVIFGKYKSGEITLNKSLSDGETLTHETFHALKDMRMITPADEYTLDKLMDHLVSRDVFRYKVQRDAEENRANTLAQLIADREGYRNRSAFYNIAQKVMDFIDGLINIGRMSARKLAKQVESGDIFNREALKKEEESIPEDMLPVFMADKNATFVPRQGPAPKKTIKAYKAFRFVDGKLYPMFVGSTQKGYEGVTPLPIGSWLDAKAGGFSFVGSNGRRYVPTFNARGGTGVSLDGVPMEIKQELVDRGYIKTVDTKAVSSVAYRPGWHAGHFPYFPQGGTKDETAPHGMRHEANTVIAEVELNADRNLKEEFEATAERTKSGKINPQLSGLRRVPVDGYYEYSTNPKFYSENYQNDKWYISGSMKINRIMPSKEVDLKLKESGIEPQLWKDDKPLFSTSDSRNGFAGERYADILPGTVIGKRMEQGRGVHGPTFIDRLKDYGTKFMHETQHFPDMVSVPSGEDKSITMEILRRHQEVNTLSQDRAAREMTDIMRNFTKDDYDDFSLELILGDEARSIRDGLRTDSNLPFGFESTGQLIRSYNAIAARNKDNDRVSTALTRRREWQREQAKKLVKFGVLKKEVLRKGDYFHHQVLQYWNDKAPDDFKSTGTTTGEVRVKWRPWMAARNGSALDYNTQYMEAELHVMAQQLAQIETAENMEQLQETNDILKSLQYSAKDANNKAYSDMIRTAMAEDFNFKDPMLEDKKRIAIGFSNLVQAIKNNSITYDSEFEDVVRDIKVAAEIKNAKKEDWKEAVGDNPIIGLGIDNPRLFPFLSHLLNKGHKGAGFAASIFKGIKGKERILKESLGQDFKTWRDFVPEGYKVWTPDPNKGWFFVNSIGDGILNQVLLGERSLEEKDVRKVLAKGKAPFWVIPSGLAKTMDNFRPVINEGKLGQLSSKILSMWKQYILINPLSVVKYNINNMSGELDAVLAYNPAIATPGAMKKAFGDLTKWSKFSEIPNSLKSELDDALKHGVIGSGFAVQEVEDTMGIMSSNDFVNGVLLEKKPGLAARWWKGLKDATQIRENILRLSAYRWFKNQIESGSKNLYGATRDTSHIDNLISQGKTTEAAARLTRDLLGDYGNISRHGEYIRRHMIPFWSWNEINLPRYVWMMKNLRHEGRSVNALSATMAKRAAVFAAKASMLAGAIILYNSTMWPDEWDELGESKRNQLHLILGRRNDGSIITLRFQGALSDALSWFGKEDFPDDIKNLVSGKSTIQEQLLDGLKASASKLINSARPETKLLYETLTGQGTYPDAFSSHPIRDKVENILKTFKMDKVYRYAVGMPGHGNDIATQLVNDLADIATYTTEPGVQAYYDIRNKVFEWKKDNGIESSGGNPTKKGNAVYYYKQAMRYGDLKAAEKYLEKYKSLGGDFKGLRLSIKNAHPLAGIDKQDRMSFMKTLSEHDKKKYEMAVKWYHKTYLEKKK